MKLLIITMRLTLGVLSLEDGVLDSAQWRQRRRLELQ